MITTSESIKNRVDRIINLVNAKIQGMFGGRFSSTNSEDKTENFSLPYEQGNFQLYFIMGEGSKILDYWYLSINKDSVDIEKELSDIRVLIENGSKGQDVYIKFIIITNEDLNAKKKSILKAFSKIKTFIPEGKRKYFELILWDKEGLEKEEEKLGLKVKI